MKFVQTAIVLILIVYVIAINGYIPVISDGENSDQKNSNSDSDGPIKEPYYSSKFAPLTYRIIWALGGFIKPLRLL
ncbi:hypothetical protein DICVIV_07469 [Dictyocaulus viviparus]|uniref:Uncharacterized protein n=1 Tax=Dictyocaulus viviparus TaxID=29172 RepID=A0A0D8XRU5_DICVI|nr:hypothetical protein DICVIV_07469 [Dictyocaulus viviparus]